MRRFFIFFAIFSVHFHAVHSQSVIWFDSEESFANQPQRSPSGESSKMQKSAVEADSILSLNFHRVKPFNSEVSAIKSLYDISTTSRLTVFVVFESSDTVEEHGIWSVVRDGKQVTGLTDKRLLRPTSDYAYPVKRRGIPLINTSMQAFSKIRGEAKDNYFALGETLLPDSTQSSFSGNIAECLVFDRFLKKAEALKIETYLAVKYGITLIESDYVSSADVVLWRYEENKDYSNGIAGLGRDNALSLSQKQGSSSEEADLLTLGLGNFSTLNKDNDFPLSDGNFLLWGHNDGGLNLAGISGEGYPLLERKWLIESTNTNNNFFTTWLKFRLPEQYRDSSQICYLAVDRSGRGDFSSKNVDYIAQNQIDTAGYVYFSDVIWHSNDVFTFSVMDKKDSVLEEVTDTAILLSDNGLQKEKSKKTSEASSPYYKYNVYPNPTTGHYRLEADFSEVTSIVVRFYTMNGHLLEEKRESGKLHYSFSGYAETQGNYLIEVESVFGKKVFHLTVVK